MEHLKYRTAISKEMWSDALMLAKKEVKPFPIDSPRTILMSSGWKVEFSEEMCRASDVAKVHNKKRLIVVSLESYNSSDFYFEFWLMLFLSMYLLKDLKDIKESESIAFDYINNRIIDKSDSTISKKDFKHSLMMKSYLSFTEIACEYYHHKEILDRYNNLKQKTSANA